MSVVRKPVTNSSSVVSAGYDPVSQVCEIEWKAGVYRAEGVKPEDWAAVGASLEDPEQSTGQLVNVHLKRFYQFAKVDAEKKERSMPPCPNCGNSGETDSGDPCTYCHGRQAA